MNKKERQTILDNIETLANSIVLDQTLTGLVVNRYIFTQKMIDDIMKTSDETERKRRFLMDLCRRGPEAFDAFFKVLLNLNQISAARVLRPKYFPNTIQTEELIRNIGLSTFGINSVINNGPNVGTSGTTATLETNEFMLTVRTTKKLMEGNQIYNMTSNPRGFCLIFNIHQFLRNVFPERLGSVAETQVIDHVFNRLHFTVNVVENPTKEVMIRKLMEYSTKPVLKSHNAFVLIVLSHGHSGIVYSSDNIEVGFEDIIKYFNNQNSRDLIGKPKLFFFSCCRGDNRDNGVHFVPELEKTVADAKPFLQKSVPLSSDMMISYSTIDGFVAWRNEKKGTWFGTALCQALMNHAHEEDLQEILRITSDIINNKSAQNGEKQVMEYTFRGFTKRLYFNPMRCCPCSTTVQKKDR